MSRRFAGAGLLRRAARTTIATIGEPPGPQVVFGDNLIEEFDSRFGVAVDTTVVTWTGRKAGLVVSAPAEANEPTFTAANAALNGRPSVNSTSDTTSGTNRGLRMSADHGSDIAASASRPYMYWIGTINAYVVSRFMLTAGGTGLTSTKAHFAIANPATSVLYRVNNDSNTQAAYATSDTTAHLWECLTEADNQLVLYRDGVEVGRDATGAAINAAVRRMAIGMGPSGIGFVDASHAACGICTSAPSAGERVAHLAWSQFVWGTP